MKTKKKIICFDIDGVVCRTNKNFYKNSKPIIENIRTINRVYESGFTVILFTARFMGRSNENILLAKKKGLSLTKKQLLKWGVKFNKLIFGKPSFDIVVDDKALNYKSNWSKTIFKTINKK